MYSPLLLYHYLFIGGTEKSEDANVSINVRSHPTNVYRSPRAPHWNQPKMDHPKNHDTTTKPKMDLVSQEIFNDIYEAALTSICIDIASDMHRCAKTGLLPYSQCVRRKVPVAAHLTSASPTKDTVASLHVKNEMQHDARDNLFDSVPSKSPTLEPNVQDPTTDNTSVEVSGTIGTRTTTEIIEGDSDPTTTAIQYGIASSDTMGLLPTSHPEKQEVPICTTTPSLRSSSYDIYGRIPPKEPKITSTICLLCGRSVSAIRFAPHLEKCMGLTAGTSRTIRDI